MNDRHTPESDPMRVFLLLALMATICGLSVPVLVAMLAVRAWRGPAEPGPGPVLAPPVAAAPTIRG